MTRSALETKLRQNPRYARQLDAALAQPSGKTGGLADHIVDADEMVKPPEPNETEKRYAERLGSSVYWGLIEGFEPWPPAFRLAYECDYTPDFKVRRFDGRIEYHEVKHAGHHWEDARIKFKVAAHQHPEFRWVWCVWQPKKACWRFEVFENGALLPKDEWRDDPLYL